MTSVVRRSWLLGAVASLVVVAIPGTASAATLPVPPQEIAVGDYGACGVSAGFVSCWGTNAEGQLGNGTLTDSAVPVVVPGIANVVSIASDVDTVCALVINGTVSCWGGVESTTVPGHWPGSTVPAQLAGLVGVKKVVAGLAHFCALIGDGGVRCWGSNEHGVLGDNVAGETYSATAVQVVGVTGATDVAAGTFSACAVVTGGHVKCWGWGGYGQIGNGGTADAHVATTVTGVSGATAVSASGFSSCAVVGGGVQCWGDNSMGGLGTGSGASMSTVPVPVPGLTGVTAVGANTYDTCVILTGGSMKCWGYDKFGSVGDGTTGTVVRPTPTPVVGVTQAVAVSMSSRAAVCAVLAPGGARCWGDNSYGNLGRVGVYYTGTPGPTTVANLVVTSTSVSPTPTAGTPIHFSATVKNIGTAATPAGTVLGVLFQIDGKAATWSDTNTTSLAPGASVTLTANSGPTGSATWTATSGTHTLTATVDDVNRIAEVDKTDNTRSSTLTVP